VEAPPATEPFAARRILMVELMLVLHRRVQDEDSLLDLLALAAREAGPVDRRRGLGWGDVAVRGGPFTAAHTDPRVVVVDQGQYGQGDGPCLAAMRTDQWVTVTGAQTRLRWPHLAPIADASGVRAYLAAPLHDGNRAIGSLNLYSTRAEGLRTLDPDVLTVLTRVTRPGSDRLLRRTPGWGPHGAAVAPGPAGHRARHRHTSGGGLAHNPARFIRYSCGPGRILGLLQRVHGTT
jgi:hypothetical protein